MKIISEFEKEKYEKYLKNTHVLSIMYEHCRKIALLQFNTFKIDKLLDLSVFKDNLNKLDNSCFRYMDMLQKYISENESELDNLEYEICINKDNKVSLAQRKKYLNLTNELLITNNYILSEIWHLINSSKTFIGNSINYNAELNIRVVYELATIYDLLKEICHCITRYEHEVDKLTPKYTKKKRLSLSEEEHKKIKSYSIYYNELMQIFNTLIGSNKIDIDFRQDESRSLYEYIKITSDYKFKDFVNYPKQINN